MRSDQRLVQVGELLPEVVAATLGQANAEHPERCPDCGRAHETPGKVPHKCRACQRREALARHDRIVAELRTIRAGGRRQKGGAE